MRIQARLHKKDLKSGVIVFKGTEPTQSNVGIVYEVRTTKRKYWYSQNTYLATEIKVLKADGKLSKWHSPYIYQNLEGYAATVAAVQTRMDAVRSRLVKLSDEYHARKNGDVA